MTAEGLLYKPSTTSAIVLQCKPQDAALIVMPQAMIQMFRIHHSIVTPSLCAKLKCIPNSGPTLQARPTLILLSMLIKMHIVHFQSATAIYNAFFLNSTGYDCFTMQYT